MTLLEKINHLNLKPRNAPAGVKVSTFGEWLRKLRAGQEIGEIPAALLTLYCDGRINESGGLKLGSAEIFSEIKPIVLSDKTKDDLAKMRGVIEDCKQVMGAKLQVPESFHSTDSVLNTVGKQKLPAKTHTSLNPTGFPSWGADKTYKFVGTMLKVNFNGRGYNALGVTKIGDSFVIDGTPYPVSEFTKVG